MQTLRITTPSYREDHSLLRASAYLCMGADVPTDLVRWQDFRAVSRNARRHLLHTTYHCFHRFCCHESCLFCAHPWTDLPTIAATWPRIPAVLLHRPLLWRVWRSRALAILGAVELGLGRYHRARHRQPSIPHRAGEAAARCPLRVGALLISRDRSRRSPAGRRGPEGHQGSVPLGSHP